MSRNIIRGYRPILQLTIRRCKVLIDSYDFKPEYKIADPICTFIFSVLVLLTTVNILKDAMNILMEGVPKGLNFAEVRSALQAIPGIVEVHNLRMWSLTMNKTAVSVHLATGMSCCVSSPTQYTVHLINDGNLLARIF